MTKENEQPNPRELELQAITKRRQLVDIFDTAFNPDAGLDPFTRVLSDNIEQAQIEEIKVKKRLDKDADIYVAHPDFYVERLSQKEAAFKSLKDQGEDDSKLRNAELDYYSFTLLQRKNPDLQRAVRQYRREERKREAEQSTVHPVDIYEENEAGTFRAPNGKIFRKRRGELLTLLSETDKSMDKDELAEEMGITVYTLNYHLRKAEEETEGTGVSLKKELDKAKRAQGGRAITYSLEVDSKEPTAENV